MGTEIQLSKGALDRIRELIYGVAGITLGHEDDIEAFESCQRAYGSWREAPWNDLSKGFGLPPVATDELPQRVFWLAWRDRLVKSRA